MKKLLIASLVCILISGCTNRPTVVDEQACEKEFSLKYPVVLVHGIASSDTDGIFHAWGRIPERLREHGIAVFLGNTDAWGSIESNAAILKTSIENILQETGSEKVNIIAHSKGGIDSRYLIWRYDFADKIISLTTISTPHRGAVLADRIYNQNYARSPLLLNAIDEFGRLSGDRYPDTHTVNYQLTTGFMAEFNELLGLVDERVYFKSLFSALESPMDDPIWAYSYRYIYSITGINDGVVSECSANWGGNFSRIEGSISHTEITDSKKRDIHGIDIPNIYLNIVRYLSEKGF